jgi:hypothetical protein
LQTLKQVRLEVRLEKKAKKRKSSSDSCHVALPIEVGIRLSNTVAVLDNLGVLDVPVLIELQISESLWIGGEPAVIGKATSRVAFAERPTRGELFKGAEVFKAWSVSWEWGAVPLPAVVIPTLADPTKCSLIVHA